MNRVSSILRRSIYQSSSKMNAFTERQQQAEKTIDLLKQQLTVLISIAGTCCLKILWDFLLPCLLIVPILVLFYLFL